MLANKTFVRLDPTRKDLIVENASGFDIAGGLQLFETASGIHVVALRAGELGAKPQVNANLSAGSKPQFGLRVVVNPALGAEDLGADPAPSSSPKSCVQVELNANFANSRDPAAVKRNTVAHEIAHCLGVKHHGGAIDKKP